MKILFSNCSNCSADAGQLIPKEKRLIKKILRIVRIIIYYSADPDLYTTDSVDSSEYTSVSAGQSAEQ
jgi:hypothetical protein